MDSVPTQNNSINNNKNGPTINTTFKPTKLSRHNSFIPYTQRPKHLSFIKPVRQYRRLPEGKKDSTGIDPVGKLKEFINKDTIKSLLRPSLYDKFDIKNPSYRHSDLVKTKKITPINGPLIQRAKHQIMKNCQKFNNLQYIIFLVVIVVLKRKV